MRSCLRNALPALVLLAAARPAPAQQPAPAAGAAPATAPAASAPAPAMPTLEQLRQVVATVNGQPITAQEVLEYLSRFPVPPGDPEEIYRVGVEHVAQLKLFQQYLSKLRISVAPKELDDAFAAEERKLKTEEGRDLKTALAESGHDEAWLRQQMIPKITWEKYIGQVATDAQLRKYADQNKDLFGRAQVRASHIFLAVPPNATPAAKEAAKQKLAGIRAEILAGKISFADAANKYSEDDANKTSPNGGDLGYFTRKGAIIDSFASRAFAMQPNQISEPVETEYGLHLILVTDRKAGEAFDFEQNKVAVLNQFRADIHERIIAQEKKTAKIDVKPMPPGLFGPPPSAAPASSPAAGNAPDTKAAAPR